jgi:ABC-type transporter Mla subunit MlaD
MKENKINAVIALSTVVGAILMLAALSYAIGKWSLGQAHHQLIIKFPNASGINANSEVKFAGAPTGRVSVVRLIPRADQTIDPLTKQFNCVEVVVEIDPKLEVGEDAQATIKQDGLGISAKYILLTPGPDHDSKDLPDGATIQGVPPFELTDLMQPAGEALNKARNLLTTLGPVLDRFDSLSQSMQSQLPPLLSHADKLMKDGDGILANLNTPDSREKINELLTNLRYATENLKVVSSNAKALTATLAEKPWRVFWGGGTVQPPSESEVLKADRVTPPKGDVDVNSSSAPAPSSESVEKKSP